MASPKSFTGASRTLVETEPAKPVETEPAKPVETELAKLVEPDKDSRQAAAIDQPSADQSNTYPPGGSTLIIGSNKIKSADPNRNGRVGIHGFDNEYGNYAPGKIGKSRHYVIEKNEIEGGHGAGIFDFGNYEDAAPGAIKAKQEEAPAPPPRKNEESKNEKAGVIGGN